MCNKPSPCAIPVCRHTFLLWIRAGTVTRWVTQPATKWKSNLSVSRAPSSRTIPKTAVRWSTALPIASSGGITAKLEKWRTPLSRAIDPSSSRMADRLKAYAVLKLLNLMEASSIDVCLDGGWGIDALLGEETRMHSDLDIIIDREDLPRLVAASQEGEYSLQPGGAETNVVLKN